MITNFFIPELNNHDVQELWFQQDGATCHTARATIDLLKDTFGDRLISRLGPVNWPPRSCDLTPLDYFLRGYVKSLVYADKPQTLDLLKDNIRRVIADIRPQMLEKVIENWTSRLDYIRASRGSPVPEIIFKMGNSERTQDIIALIRRVDAAQRTCTLQWIPPMFSKEGNEQADNLPSTPAGLSMDLARNHDTPATIRYLDHLITAAPSRPAIPLNFPIVLPFNDAGAIARRKFTFHPVKRST
ncbi:uncharacterized protein TNCV_4294091 [Trichonephila clavipes]|uniref:Transposase n=1 Tax=Trichonephila clavipes TaxID=2585209 RepID=A0A8X6V5Y6_TRICX|nr:uncharacterized protein TNCV_4294091 [Trichonephila clavipes]